MPSPREARNLHVRIGLAILALPAGIVGIALGSAAATFVVLGAAGAIVISTWRKVAALEKRDQMLVRQLDVRATGMAGLMDQLNADEDTIFAMYSHRGEYCCSIIGHKDPEQAARLRREGVLVSREELEQRADGGIAMVIYYAG